MFRILAIACMLAVAPIISFFSSETQKKQEAQGANTESEAVQNIRKQVAAGGPVTIPPGVHFFLQPLELKQKNSLPSTLIGGGPEISVLDFTKMPNELLPAIRIDREWGYRLQGFTVRGSGRANGGVGIDVNTSTPNANGSYGTCSGQSVWDQLTVAGFTTGIRIGNRDKFIAASEMVYNSLKVVQCRTCIELNDFNTLNHLFLMLQIGDCDVGMLTNGASSVSILGGSASYMKGVGFSFGNTDKASLRDFRIEESSCGIFFGTSTTVTQLLLENCQFHQRANLDKEDTGFPVKNALVIGGSANVLLNSCNFEMTFSGEPIRWAKNGPDGSITANSGSATCKGDLISYSTALSVANPGRLTCTNVARTKPGHIPNGWFGPLGTVK